MEINSNNEIFNQDIYDVLHLFYPDENLKEKGKVSIFLTIQQNSNNLETIVEIKDENNSISKKFINDISIFPNKNNIISYFYVFFYLFIIFSYNSFHIVSFYCFS